MPDFEVLRLLGRGGFGEVWLARSKVGVCRAIKLLPKDSGLTEIEFDGIRQYQTFARNHPNLIDVLHVGETDRHFYYVMELTDGYPVAPTFDPEHYEPRSLARDLELRGALALGDAVSVTHEILHGLEHLHQSGLLHRDVKPANILFGNGVAKLADVGLLARERRWNYDGGTPSYAPPEGVQDRSGDLYCLGRVLYEMVSGLPIDRFPEAPSVPDSEMCRAFRRIAPVIDQACAPDPADRFDHTDAFAAALDQAVGAGRLSGTPGTSSPPRKHGRRLGIVLVGVALVILVWSLGRPPRVAPSGPANLADARMQVLYKNSSAATEARVVEPETLPLCVGEIVRLEIELPTPAYALVALVTATEGVQIVYPAADGLDTQQQVRRFGVPANAGKWWNLSSPAAPLTFVLLASSEPLTEETLRKVKQRLATLEPPLAMDGQSMLKLARGRVEPVLGVTGDSRALDARDTVSSEPAFAHLRRVQAAFEGEFDVVQALTLPLVEAGGVAP
ncbi:MAG: protein kinase [Phycisphaerae bacterium]|nr:protein kinase [Phycisphaerae bacterium]